MFILQASLRFPIYSIKLEEAYQVGGSYLLPPPSTIIGSFLQSLAMVKSGIFYGKNLNEAISAALSFSNEYIIAATIRALEPIVPATIIVNRWTILEANERRKKEGSVQYKEVKDYAKVRDARIREYLTSMSLKIFLLFHDAILERITSDELKIILFNISRMGDTESLVSVIEEPEIIKAQPYRKDREVVNTLTPTSYVTNFPLEVVYSDMYSFPHYGKYVRSGKEKSVGKPERYILPLRMRKFYESYAYEPTSFEAELAQDVDIVEADGDKILVRSKHDSF
ncbi:MAG: type I-A CRISPR-associated protein Cas5a [Nitrososphaerales archaeon]